MYYSMKIYEPSGRAREYSPLALNYFKENNYRVLKIDKVLFIHN